MPSIESIGRALGFKVDPTSIPPLNLENKPNETAVHVQVRALEGMQKEAIVHYGPTGSAWRMVSDEGPYLNGTDLAPFPLAFYTAGMAFSFMEELLRHAKADGIAFKSVRLTQDNYYTMEGSALRGDMIGGAKPVEIEIEFEADAPRENIEALIERARASSAPQSYMSDVIANTFALCVNGQKVHVESVAESPVALRDDPQPYFDAVQPLGEDAYQADLITKLKSAENVFGVEGGAGSSLKSEQKRTLHVRGICTLREDGLKEVLIQLFKPIGSTFRFISDDSEQERAPSGLAYLSAGVGFCFMTQIGRYAHIIKHELPSYRIVQHNRFAFTGSAENADLRASAHPVDTHVFVTYDEGDEAAQRLVYMSERTCFLHAAMRTSNDTQIKVSANGA